MELPLAYRTEPGDAPVISVDGAFDAPGLNLSHWPGNRTPRFLRRDLSCEIALAFSSLEQAEQRRLARGCTALVNNHYDTDGNAALFAVLRPTLALPRARALIAAAAAGDFFQGADEGAFVLDTLVGAFADRERSPIAAQLRGLDDEARSLRSTEYLFERFADLLDGRNSEFAPLYAEPLASLRADLADLSRAAKDDLAHLDLCVWTAAPEARSGRPGSPGAFDPGRHALFAGPTPAGSAISPSVRDRALVVGPRGAGATYRLVISTFSWFDLPTRAALGRPHLEQLALRLNEMEGTALDAPVRWRAQPTGSPSPELWFGRAQGAWFAEHCGALEVSGLAPTKVRRVILEMLRGALELPE